MLVKKFGGVGLIHGYDEQIFTLLLLIRNRIASFRIRLEFVRMS